MIQNNETFGISFQYAICNKYNLKNNISIDRIDFNLVNSFENIIYNIFINLNDYPVEFCTFNEDFSYGSSRSPINFKLSSGNTLSIKTNSKPDRSMQAPPVVGQCGDNTFKFHFGHLYEGSINSNIFKKITISKVSDMLPIYLDYCFICDYTIWIYKDAHNQLSYKLIIRSAFPDYVWDKTLFSFTKSLSDWNDSNTLKYNNKSIGEFQSHLHRPGYKFRFNFKNLIPLLEEIQHNNESLGMSCERVICDIFKIQYGDSSITNRSLYGLETILKPIIQKAFNNLPAVIKHTGSNKGERGGTSKCSYDFLLEGNRTLSLKTNTGGKICPPEVGQPSSKTFLLYFGHLINEDFSDDAFKRLCLNKIDKMIPIYLKYLFDSDYMLWIMLDSKTKKYNYRIFNSYDLSHINWDILKFSFTRNFDEWTESSTVKYAGISIGEFQIHKKRNSYKFRFNMNNLIKILKQEFNMEL